MGTRAVYTFKSHGESFHVYKHWDNIPKHAAAFIAAAAGKAWTLPRFEADEYAAAFIAVNKTGEGDIRLIKSPNDIGDAAYFYTIEHDGNGLVVTCRDWEKRRIYKGSLPSFDAWALAYDEAY